MTENAVVVSDLNARLSRLQNQLREKERELQERTAQLAFVREELAKVDHVRLQDAEKWRKREQDLQTEIGLLRRGVAGACSCPAGKCMKTARGGQLCWAQWAGLVAIRDVAQRAIDDALRAAVHPRRTHDERDPNVLPALAGETKVTLPHICSFDRQPDGKHVCACGRPMP